MWKWIKQYKQQKRKEENQMKDLQGHEKEIYLAGGCFWGVEAFFKKIPGILQTTCGYANGKGEAPTYEEVCQGEQGFVECVHLLYDSKKLSLTKILKAFFMIIDPTSVNQQGGDKGIQYRTGIYYCDEEDVSEIQSYLLVVQQEYHHAIVTEVQPLVNFYPAESYHQDYLDKNPNGYCHINLAKANSFIKEECMKEEISPLMQTIKEKGYAALSPEEAREKLTALQYQVAYEKATETPFDNAYDALFDKGIYVDVVSGEPLFLSSDKFHSGCGWPAFSKPICEEVIIEKVDHSHFMKRTEITSRIANIHLGHVFTDGPKESGGLRYCINSASLRFIPYEEMEKEDYGYLLPYIKD